MSSLDLRVLVLERQRWQLQQDLDSLESIVSGGGLQPHDATLDAFAALVGTPNTFAYFTATESMALTGLSAYSRSLLAQADAGTWRSTLGLGTLATANAPLSVAQGGTGGTDAGTARANLGLGTMSTQNANAVAITGGTATLSGLTVSSSTALSGQTEVFGRMSIGNSMSVNPSATLKVDFLKNTYHALMIRPNDSDAGSAYSVIFVNTGAAAIGSISTTASATSYNTSSDARLKFAVVPLNSALDVVRALRPVRFRWNANDEPGEGFLAHELMRHVPAAVTGEPDEVHEDGSIKPQQVDHGRLVPWLTACCQELAAQVQALTARVDAISARLSQFLGIPQL